MKRPGRPMFRVVLLLLAWAAVGALVNVAVAWGCVFVATETSNFMPEAEAEARMRRWTSIDRDAYPITGLSGEWSASVGWRLDILQLIQTDLSDARVDRSLLLFIQESGWPAPSLVAAFGGPSPTITTPTFGLPRSARRSQNDLRWLPVLPIWPGFAINTVFYAAMLWVLFGSPFGLAGLRKRRRIKRGLCLKCAYDLRGRNPASDASVCPECGTAVAPKKAVTA